MEKFPSINKNQFAVLLADRNTGHVLDIDSKLKINDSQRAYVIFDSLQEAILYTREKVISNREIECAIFDSLNNLFLRVDKNSF